MNKRIVGLTVGLWAMVLLITAVRYVNTGRVSSGSLFAVAIGLGILLALASHVPQRRVTRWLLRVCAVAAIAVATFVFL
jgi:hypothetical protein